MPKTEHASLAPEPIVETSTLRLKPVRDGLLWYFKHDAYVGASIDRYGEFSAQETALFRQFVQPGWTVLDVGANIGAHTVELARMVRLEGRVFAFEPQRLVHHVLCANLAMNDIGNTVAVQAALGAQTGQIAIAKPDYGTPDNFGGISLLGSATGPNEPVPMTTIDTLSLSACHFIKVDVEGMEIDVLRGASGTLRRFRPLLYLENDRDRQSEALLTLLLGVGYRLYWHFPPLYNAANFYGDPVNIFPGLVSINVLGIPQERPASIKAMEPVLGPGDGWRDAVERQNRNAGKTA
ncbi:MAG: FkbM family methyltransferase [Alphaproteobacteria bacterium]